MFSKYRLVSKKGEGTFSEVMKAQSVVTGEYYAIKCMKNHFKSIEQVNSLREIQALRRLNPHENIIDLEEVLYDKQTGRLALVFELMDMNIYELIRGRKQYVKPTRLKALMYQLVKAVAHMHSHGIFHRDIKPENILIMGEELKVADFGSCRGIYTKPPYTEYISTRWYRAPECLLTNGWYDYKMDMWGVGCVMFEVVSLFPLFPGTNELNQIEKVHNILGTPGPELIEMFKKHSSHINNFNFPRKEGTGLARLIPHASEDLIDLIEQLLIYNPEKRISAMQALRHPYFRELREAEERSRVRTASPTLSTMPNVHGGLHSSGGVPGSSGGSGTANTGANCDSSDLPSPAPANEMHRERSRKKLPVIKSGVQGAKEEKGNAKKGESMNDGKMANETGGKNKHKRRPPAKTNANLPSIGKFPAIVDNNSTSNTDKDKVGAGMKKNQASSLQRGDSDDEDLLAESGGYSHRRGGQVNEEEEEEDESDLNESGIYSTQPSSPPSPLPPKASGVMNNNSKGKKVAAQKAGKKSKAKTKTTKAKKTKTKTKTKTKLKNEQYSSYNSSASLS